MYRPEGWEKILADKVGTISPGDAPLIEAVADAVLKALRKESLRTPEVSGYLLKRMIDERKGSLVFIPDDEVE